MCFLFLYPWYVKLSVYVVFHGTFQNHKLHLSWQLAFNIKTIPICVGKKKRTLNWHVNKKWGEAKDKE